MVPLVTFYIEAHSNYRPFKLTYYTTSPPVEPILYIIFVRTNTLVILYHQYNFEKPVTN